VSVNKSSDVVTHEWQNRPRDFDWRFRASLCPQNCGLAWLVGWFVGWFPVILPTYTTYEDGTDSVPKRRHIKFRRWGITKRKKNMTFRTRQKLEIKNT